MIDEWTIDHIALGRALVLLDRFRLPRAWATVTSIPLATKRRTSAVPIAPDPRMATFLGCHESGKRVPPLRVARMVGRCEYLLNAVVEPVVRPKTVRTSSAPFAVTRIDRQLAFSMRTRSDFERGTSEQTPLTPVACQHRGGVTSSAYAA
jgi:hypothetical protein